MQDVAPISPTAMPVGTQTGGNATRNGATDQFGLSFESLLQIVLTQLTYQDPLEPMDNFEFVSQLAQFSQIQLTQEMNDSLSTLVTAQASGQASGLLGRTIDIAAGSNRLSGRVIAVVFGEGPPTLTIETAEGREISGLPVQNVAQIRETE